MEQEGIYLNGISEKWPVPLFMQLNIYEGS